MRVVIRRCNGNLSQLENYEPADDDEQINVETAIELFEGLLARAELQTDRDGSSRK